MCHELAPARFIEVPDRSIDGFAIELEPGADLFEAGINGGIEFSGRVGADAHEVIAVAGHNAAEVAD